MCLRVLIDDDFSIDSFRMNDFDEFEAIFSKIEELFRLDLKKLDKVRKYHQLLKIDDLIHGDLLALHIACLILLEIGIHGYKSGLLISTVSMLNEDDQLELKKLMYDSQDLNVKNLILSQRINMMELDNSSLKQKLKQYQLELDRHEKTKSELESTMEHAIHAKEEEIIQLQMECQSIKSTNKELSQSLSQLNHDLKQIDSFQQSPIKRSRRDELDLLKWQYNLLTEWIAK
jgi:hypothetical protein